MSVNTIFNINNTNDANFRAWCLAIHNVLLAGGWTLTADTGQIDLATVLAPVAVNTAAGYEIWKSNDAGGGLTDIYVKLEYGSGGDVATTPSIWITVGWGSNGTGSVNGVLSTRTQFRTKTAIPHASAEMNICAGSGYFVIAFFDAYTGSSNSNFVVSLERTRDTTLAFQNQVHVCGLSNQEYWYSQCLTPTRVHADPAGLYQSIMPQIVNTPYAGQVALGLIFGMAVGPTSPSINILGVENASLGLAGDNVTVNLYGADHQYKLQSLGITNSYVFMAGVAGVCCMTRYE